MKSAIALVLLVVSGSAFAQLPAGPAVGGTFHIEGRVTFPVAPTSPMEAAIKGDIVSETVPINTDGAFAADMPFGNYTITVQKTGRLRERAWRPLFRVTSATNVLFNMSAAGTHCAEEFKIPDADGTPFKMMVRCDDYWWNPRTHDYKLAVAEYNLHTLRANHITFHKKEMTLSADGNVVLEDGSGKQQLFESLNIKITKGAFVVLSSNPKSE